MKYNPITRRHFLQGAAASLSLPLLASLFPEKVWAQIIATGTQKNFVAVPVTNGLFRTCGPTSDLMPKTTVVDGAIPGYGSETPAGRHRIHYKSLTELAAANGGKISTLIDSAYTPYLSKMTMIQALDILAYECFHHQAHFGSMHRCYGGPDTVLTMYAQPSLEQYLAYSPTFNKSPSTIGKAVAYCATWAESRSGYELSSTYENPSNKATSGMISTPASYDPLALWSQYFGSSENPTGTPSLKTTLVDKVLSDYKSLVASRKLASEDKKKLDQHIAFLYETQTRVNRVGAVCSQMKPASSYADRKLLMHAMNDVVVSLIGCGLAHSFMAWSYMFFTDNGERWHNVAHDSYNGGIDAIGNQASYDENVEFNRCNLNHICLDLMKKLDAIGQLDNSLIVYMQEHSKNGHETFGIPAIMFGGGACGVRTGEYIDYRNMRSGDDLARTRRGFPMNQFWANLLRFMDVPITEFEAYNKPGYTAPYFKDKSGWGSTIPIAGSQFGDNYGSWSGHDLSAWLPRLKV